MLTHNENAITTLKQYIVIENIIRDYYEQILLDKLNTYTYNL
jgi:hypothetical protein